MRKVLGFTILFGFLLINFVSAQFISGDVYIYENGEARFEIETDLEGFPYVLSERTSNLTSKLGSVWTFALDLPEYERILLDVHLPSSLDSITSVSGVDSIININDKIISLVDDDKKLDFEVSYKLKSEEDSYLGFYLFILIVVCLIFWIFRNRKKIGKERERLNYIMPMINDNEKKIVELLMKRPMRQKEIRKTLDIPKASFSRYIINLEKKKLIFREGEGKNKVVRLK